MLDGPYLNHEDNALNDDLKLPQGPITRSRAKKFKEALQGFMRNIWDNHAYEDPIRFEGLNGVYLKLNGLYSTYLKSKYLVNKDGLILSLFWAKSCIGLIH